MIPLHEPCFNKKDEELILEALRSSWVSTGGPFVEQFELAFANYVNSKYAISACNGTAALHLAIEVLKRTLKIDEPFEVIVPTLSFIATANAVVHAGGKPIFVDCAKDSLNVSVDVISDFVERHYRRNDQGSWVSKTQGTPLLCILPAHIMGYGGQIAKLSDFCREMAIPLLEDAAEALGSRTKDGRHLGTFGVASIFSFNGNKILTTGGGGMIVTDDPEFARRAKHISTTAKSDAANYVHDEVGYNYRLVNLLGALGLTQLRSLDERIKRKTEIYERYVSHLPHAAFYIEANCLGNHWLVNLQVSDLEKRNGLLKRLNENQIGARPLWMPFHKQPALDAFRQHEDRFPYAENAWERTISLPSSAHLKDEEVDGICDIIRQHG